jgi:hypothetical protein
MQTKILVGLAVAAALTGGMAQAAITNPGAGTGEVIELVVDNNNGQVYARGTEVTFDQVLPTGALQSSTSYPVGTPPIPTGFTFAPIKADGALQTFLAQDGGSDTFSYALIGAGQNLGNASPQLGPNKPGGNVMEFTSLNTVAAGNLTVMTGTAVSNAVAAVKTDVTTLNGIIGGNPGDGTSANVSAQFNGNTSAFVQLYGNNTPVLASLGQDMNLYAMTGNGSPSAAGQVYTGGLVEMLSNGTLEAVGAAVPLPGAVWLFGSGLLGLAGIRRRRAGELKA